jgi:hypothetical protein
VSRLERWQPEGVAAVLDPEDAQEEGVHAENDSTPNDRDLLLAGIGHSRLMVAKERMPSVNIGQYAGVVAVK